MSAQVLAFKSPANELSYADEQTTVAGMFGEYMLMELVLEVARNSSDPHSRLADLFDRISTRARVGSHAKGALMAQFRKHAETFFMMAAKNV